MAISGVCSFFIGLLQDAPLPILIIVSLIWGTAVVADSAQFSTIVTEVAEQAYVGTALTLQLATGFSFTVATIWLIPLLENVVTWQWAFSILAPGPLLGVLAMVWLYNIPEARSKIANGKG